MVLDIGALPQYGCIIICNDILFHCNLKMITVSGSLLLICSVKVKCKRKAINKQKYVITKLDVLGSPRHKFILY